MKPFFINNESIVTIYKCIFAANGNSSERYKADR